MIRKRDWKSCFFCQAYKQEPLCKPSESVQLRNNPDRLHNCFQEVAKNIRCLHAVGGLRDDVKLNDVLFNISGGGDATVTTDESLITLMKDNDFLWHGSCRRSVNAQKVKRVENKIQSNGGSGNDSEMETGSTP
jgi:hypothetical protein